MVVGTRPQIIKTSLIINLLKDLLGANCTVVHTGQHYDYSMSGVFFQHLLSRNPDYSLGITGTTHSSQVGKMLVCLEGVLREIQPDIVLVPGDTNSALAAGLCAAQLRLPFAHLEAGARSFKRTMIEETNRVLLDHVASLELAPTPNCRRNLLKEGIDKATISCIGDTMLDVLKLQLKNIEETGDETSILDSFNVLREQFDLLTIHREENSEPAQIRTILKAACLKRRTPLLIPAHPRIKPFVSKLKQDLKLNQLVLIDPVGYRESVVLTKNAQIVFTDSGGLQKEAYWLHTRCVTLRDETEWTETLQSQANILVGTSRDRIVDARNRIESSAKKPSFLRIVDFGNGHASKKAVDELLKFCENRRARHGT